MQQFFSHDIYFGAAFYIYEKENSEKKKSIGIFMKERKMKKGIGINERAQVCHFFQIKKGNAGGQDEKVVCKLWRAFFKKNS